MRLDDDRTTVPLDSARRQEREPRDDERGAPASRAPQSDEQRRRRALTERERRERWPIG